MTLSITITLTRSRDVTMHLTNNITFDRTDTHTHTLNITIGRNIVITGMVNPKVTITIVS